MLGGDATRIRHMLDAAVRAVDAAHTKTRSHLEHDPVWALGLVKIVETIGEAASRDTEETRQQHPGIPWQQIVAMRNRLVHAYFDIDPEQVWKAITEDIPPLVEDLEEVLKSLEKT